VVLDLLKAYDPSEFNVLRIQSARPEQALRPFVTSFVQKDAELGSIEVLEPVVARVGVTVEFKLAGQYQIRICGSESRIPSNRISIVGPQTWRRVRKTLTGRIDSTTILFEPLGFHALFSMETSQLANISTPGQALLGNSMLELYERLGNLETFPERTALLNQYLLSRLKGANEFDPAHRAIMRLTLSAHPATIGSVALQSGLSVRQLERKCLAYAGVTPKMLARLTRFNRAIQMSRRTRLSWTEIAQETYYHDQMHMIRDFHTFAGEAPTKISRQIAPHHLINFCEGQISQELEQSGAPSMSQ
jgi:AraC-like DNA-binding protein